MSGATDRWARLLTRLYPSAWRRTFPDFVEVLAAGLAERPLRVTANVLATSAEERLRAVGWFPAGRSDRRRTGLAMVVAALLPFTALATGLWSQLQSGLVTQGTQAPVPLQGAAVTLAVAASLVLLAAMISVVAVAIRSLWRAGRPGRLGPSIPGPAVAFAGALGALCISGWLAGRSGWYSPAAAALPRHGGVEVSLLWIRGSVTMISPAWVHPSIFGTMPAGQLVATLMALPAMVVAVGSLAAIVRRLPSLSSWRLDAGLAVVAVGAMILAVGACARWLLTHPGRQGATAHLASVDQLAPGHTGWSVALVLLALTALAAGGTRWLLESGDPPSVAEG